MKVSTVYLFMFFSFVLSAQAQMKKMDSVQGFERRLRQEAKTIQSIESDFTQVKYLDVFDEKVTSKGTFYYKKSNMVCMNYARPMNYQIVINGGKLKIVSDGKKNVMNLTANKIMKEMQGIITACMVGDLSQMSSGYQQEYFEDSNFYLVKIKPMSSAVKAYITNMQVYLDKKDMSVHKLRLFETAKNYTEYTFYNKKFNSLKDDKKFSVR
ncbi:outer membrane lipoprotein carrier protein LolA [uncultured Bacteroides sp.]|uniref:outer membrane lipoprotein carrier protein LolA n=1 Tax=uncultured Bacteroides sp. TaxID=162156 RepID=UPI002AAAA560|nr:outer membrane lipoprotein carrier protein LolA [uncultured Bacteroides sp.]